MNFVLLCLTIFFLLSSGTYAAEDVWEEVRKKKENSPIIDLEELVTRRPGWKTVRIFVSSTCEDFYDERDILVKQVIKCHYASIVSETVMI